MVKTERTSALKNAKPILFNTDMVRAILNGKKTVTRRIIKPRFRENERGFFTATIAGQLFLCYSDEDDNETRRVKSPYQIDDILYVREAFWHGVDDVYEYKADYETDMGYIWSPSIHMPKKAARIFLRVTDVRVERLQDIENNNKEAKREGFDYQYIDEDFSVSITPWVNFSVYWDNTVKKSDLNKYGWNANPWVWVIEFERVEVTE